MPRDDADDVPVASRVVPSLRRGERANDASGVCGAATLLAKFSQGPLDMLTTLGKRSNEQPTMRDLLVDCHARIRTFCALAKRLSQGGRTEQIRSAATQLHRYFGIALPLHLRDEDESIRPRLERLGDRTLSDALRVMTHEHVAADIALAELLEQWEAIAHDPSDARCFAAYKPTVWLDRHLLAHLHDEETRIFPLLDRLPRAQWDAIVGEMKARRR
jgi:hemerythrin-like domain-containing protein